MSEGGDWTPEYRSDRWVTERAAFAGWRATPSGPVWSASRRHRFRRWLIEYRAHEVYLVHRQLADEQRERLVDASPESLA